MAKIGLPSSKFLSRYLLARTSANPSVAPLPLYNLDWVQSKQWSPIQ